MIDGVVLTDKQTRQADINYFLRKGIENRKIILWENKPTPEFYTAKDHDGSDMVFMEGLEFHLRNNENINFFYLMHNHFTRQKIFYALPPSQYRSMIEKQYARPIDWDNPKNFTEKIQWMKLYDSTPIKTRLADKYLVRQWVAEKIGEEYLIPLLGVWDNFDDIDFDLLPEQFVLKCNHGCGYNIIVRDKKTFDIQNAREKINAWMNLDFGTFLYELHYNNIKKKIIAEKFITDGKSLDIPDYKFICFKRKPYYCFCCTERSTNLSFDYFDMDWNHMDFERADHLNSQHPEKIRKPKTFKLMKKLAAELCKDFEHVRVDFYEVAGKVYFGEMTFTPGAGAYRYNSIGTDEYFGSLITLPKPFPFKFDSMTPIYSIRQNFNHEINIHPPKAVPKNARVIASLTSWTKRIATVHLAIQTILAQTRKPDLTVLYLADSEFPNRKKDLPKELTALLSDKFEIHWTKDIKSYKKLIPALKEFPNDIIITFDDDLLFHQELVERLLISYEKNPQYIHCHRITNISFDKDWNISFTHIPYSRPTYLQKLTGCGGVLYPPHSLAEEVLREEKFMTLAPTSDDIWFWLMGAMNGYKVNVVENNIDALDYIPGTQEVGLTRINDAGEKFFFKHIKNVLDAYPILKDILFYEQFHANFSEK